MTQQHLDAIAQAVAAVKAVHDALRAESERLARERKAQTPSPAEPRQNPPSGG